MEKSKKPIFLSYSYSDETPGYGGQKGFDSKSVKSILCGDSCNQLTFTMTNHIGTHIDTPRHFFKDGLSLTDYPAAFWCIEKMTVINLDLSPGTLITSEHLSDSLDNESELLIINTGFWKRRGEDIYWSNNPGLSKELGLFLRKNYPNLKIIGGDFISATSYSNRPEGKLAHQAFLDPKSDGTPIMIIEDMKLDQLNFKPNSIIISPLLLEKADGAPVTIFAF